MRTDLGKRRLAILLSALAGHLPGAVQKRMEHDFGAPAKAMTTISALPLFTVGVFGLLAARIAGFGGPPIAPEWMIEHQYLMAFLTVESTLRLVSALIQGAPMGSLAGALLYDAWGYLRARPAHVGPSAPAITATGPDRRLDDRYTMLEPLLALLSPDEQERLERHFAFDPLRWGRRTSTFILFVAGANVLISVAAFRSGTDVFLDFAALVIGCLFIAEQVGRRKRIAQGHPAGSVLGALVRPLARPLIEAARS
jgi:hypothetical protein